MAVEEDPGQTMFFRLHSHMDLFQLEGDRLFSLEPVDLELTQSYDVIMWIGNDDASVSDISYFLLGKGIHKRDKILY